MLALRPEDHAFIEGLIEQMSLAQKVGQILQTERLVITPEEVRDHHVGSVLSGGGSCPGDNRPSDWVSMNDAYWAASMAEGPGRLPIPILYGVDAIHGHSNVRGATVFPHNINLGAINDPDLVRRIGRATAREVLSTGVDWTFAPTLAVARDRRWGRTYESCSEDPALVARLAPAFVEGLQGDLGDEGIAACLKHFVGDGGTSEGIEQGDTRVSEAELRRIHLAPYPPALAAGALTVMASFNSWNGDKCHGHRYLLTDVLKGELGFEGLVISDWDGIDYLDDDYSQCVARGLNAGIDLFMVSENWRTFLKTAEQQVREGVVPESRLDDAVRRILRVKVALGLFTKPRPAQRPLAKQPELGCPEHRGLAREAVRRSLVLLKNDDALLPLPRSARVLLAGKSANDLGNQCGGFTVEWQGASGNHLIEGGSTVFDGIRALASACDLDPEGHSADQAKHDVAVVVIGERPYAEGLGDIRSGEDVLIREGSQIRGKLKKLEPYGRSAALEALHPEDLETLTRIKATGIPVVTVMLCGRPLATDPELAQSDAFVVAWLPGSEGAGIGEALFAAQPKGEALFPGRLPFAWPKDGGAPQWQGDEQENVRFPRGFPWPR